MTLTEVKEAIHRLVIQGRVERDLAVDYISDMEEAFEPSAYFTASEEDLFIDIELYRDAKKIADVINPGSVR